jgi:magnesium chelatase subunit D
VNPSPAPPSSAWDDAAVAAALVAIDPALGANVRSGAGPVRDQWLALLRELLPASAPVRRIPLAVSDGRLLGGLDLAATLRAGRPIADRGLLAEAGGGIVLLAMAERIATATAARITAALDTKEIILERDGLTLRTALAAGVVALDEGLADDECPPSALLDRLAFHLDFAGIRADAGIGRWHARGDIDAARARLPAVRSPDDVLHALCETAFALGIASIRAPLLALRAARAAAALDGRSEVTVDDATLAARLVLAPRATLLPAAAAPPEEAAPGTTPQDPEDIGDSGDVGDTAPPEPPRVDAQQDPERPLDDVVLEAAQAAIPAGLLAQLKAGNGRRARIRSTGRAGAVGHSSLRGRPAGIRRGQPRSGARLNIVETLRAAAPWQRLRGRGVVGAAAAPGTPRPRVEVRLDDFHVSRFRHRAETTTIFVVDASGSAALHRLAEAKGAVELLLADCYVRRDRVAVLAFRGRGTEILLPPTRSLVRAKRSLASLAGGGGTPLAAGLAAAAGLADAILRRGGTPTVVVLTDGRANIARDGSPGRARAHEDAMAAARVLRAVGGHALLVDTSPQPQALAAEIARAMDARYLALPHADAGMLSKAVRTASIADAPRGTAQS